MSSLPDGVRPHLPALLGLLAAVAALNAPALLGGFSDPDDFAHLEAGLGIAGFDGDAWRQVLFPPKGVTAMRPLPWLLWGMNAAVFGLKPLGYYLTNLGLHLLLCALVYGAAFQLGRSRGAALVAGALVGLAPATHQAVYYLAGRDDQLANVAYVGAFLLWQRGRGRWPAAGVLLAGLLCKLTVATLPVLLLILDRSGGGRRRPWRDYLPFAVAFAAYGALLIWSWGHADPSSLLTPAQRAGIGNVGVFFGNVGQAAIVPLVAKHGGVGVLVMELPRLFGYGLLIAALIVARGPERKLAWAGGVWLILNLVIPYPWVVVDTFRAQDSGRYLQLPLIGWALLVASACSSDRGSWVRRAAAPATLLAVGLSFVLGVSPGLGRSKAPVDAFVRALKAATDGMPPDGRIVLGVTRLDHGIVSIGASSLLDELVPGLPSRPYYFVEGQTTLWQDTRAERSYEYGRYEAVDPAFRVRDLDRGDRLLVDAVVNGQADFASVQLPMRTTPGSSPLVWDFTAGEALDWQWRGVPRQMYADPPRDPKARVAPAPAAQGVGLELWGDRFIPPGVLGRLVSTGKGDPPHVVSPPLSVVPAQTCALELVLQLPERVFESDSEAAFLVPSQRFALVAWTEEADFDALLDRFLLVPLSAWPGEQTATVRLDNAPTWLGSGTVQRLAIVASNVPGAADLKSVTLSPCM
jgi:hypothetical protein